MMETVFTKTSQHHESLLLRVPPGLGCACYYKSAPLSIPIKQIKTTIPLSNLYDEKPIEKVEVDAKASGESTLVKLNMIT